MANTPEQSPPEKEFRDKNQWYSFTSAAWGALGMASFFGALTTLAMGLISVASNMPAKMGDIPTPSAYLLSGPLPYLAMGGLLALGAAATYMSQSAATEVRVLQDQHLAQQNAKCVAPAKGLEQAEYAQNCRADAKKWEEVTMRAAQQIHI